MTFRKKIANIENLPDNVLEALQEKYPEGWEGQTTKITNAKGEYFRAITLDFEDISYLIKVPIEIDSVNYWEKDDDLDEIVEKIADKSIEKELEEEVSDEDEDVDEKKDDDDDDDVDDDDEDEDGEDEN
ncbi:MAG: hypothetical protein KKG99_05415 [Bacteroidetes bacterium]|nr:hypothetical protein [Bacteroidota bacterium]